MIEGAHIDVEVEDPAWTQAVPEVARLAELAAFTALAAMDPQRWREGVTILLADDAAVAELNANFRQKEGSTNVLAFPAPPNPEYHLGDIALAFGVCAREADEQGKPLAAHLQHLVAHGVLHLVGYDHQTDAQAEAMEDLERTIMDRLGLPDPYL